jgi:hypothetical protein
MLITDDALRAVDAHWAVAAIGADGRSRGLEVAQVNWVRDALRGQMNLDFADQPTDASLAERLATAYEVAALEGLDAALLPTPTKDTDAERMQCMAGAWRAFDIRRTLPTPQSQELRILNVLRLAGLAYACERWPEFRRWIDDHTAAFAVPDVGNVSWDRRLLFRIFDCWCRLLRKRTWEDVSQVASVIATLRKEQATYEDNLLKDDVNANSKAMALRLISLYHWAKASELLATYVLQGSPSGIAEELDKHFEAARKAAHGYHDAELTMVLYWLHLAARRMVAASVWWVAQAVNSRVTKFIETVTKSKGLFELLPPQRVAIREQGLLDQAHRAIVVDLPTSGGKTLLAQFRMLQALNQFAHDGGWVAYVAPTKALVSQVTRRLRKDFSAFKVVVEQLTGAVEVDAFEEAILSSVGNQTSFDVLVSTPEKLQLVLRNKKVSRPLVLIVMDEAHNIEDGERGMRVEFLLATIRRECEKANFLLMMPFVPNGDDLARWLSPESGTAVSIGTSPWKPNDRVVGLHHAEKGANRGDWGLRFETLVTTSQRTLALAGTHSVDGNRPLGLSWTDAQSPNAQTAAIAAVFSERGTSIAVANQIRYAWSMARTIAKARSPLPNVSEEVKLVQRFLGTEISPDFELIGMLAKGIAVHHAGLSDETRSLIEWLTEENHIKVLCATSTIAQGINFPVSSVFLASTQIPLAHPPWQKPMTPREFWNLAGRAGRIGQDSIGVVGIASGDRASDLRRFIADATGSLVSRLVQLLDDLYAAGKLHALDAALSQEEWQPFRAYVAHLWAEKKNLDAVLADTEQLLRHTFGYSALRSKRTPDADAKADALLSVTKKYVQGLSQHPENAVLADATGFAPEGVRSALLGLNTFEQKLNAADWEPSSLFGATGASALPALIGVMMKIPELNQSLTEITRSGQTQTQIAEMTASWVNGASIRDIAIRYFMSKGGNETDALTDACRAIYRTLVNAGPWGISALTKMPTSGLNFENLPPEVRQRLNAMPAMIYHGVRTEAAVVMRMNSIPRSIAEALGAKFTADAGGDLSVRAAREFLHDLKQSDWNAAVPEGSKMSGADYREIWRQLSGDRAQQ